MGTHIREIKSRFKADADISVFTTARNTFLGTTLPLILWPQCKLSLLAKHKYFEATYLPTFIAENRNSWSNSSICPYTSLTDVRIKKQKAVLFQAWTDPEGSRKLGFPDFVTTAQDGGRVVSLTHRPLLPPGNTPGKHFC